LFTGIVEALATLTQVVPEPPGVRMVVREPNIAAKANVGHSIAINGCCLTVVDVTHDWLAFEAGPETLSRTNLGLLVPGAQVNLERSLRIGDEVGGHFVTGHVDGVGVLESRIDEGDWSTCWFRAPAQLMPQMASKGSIAVDGVSLTLVEVQNERFSVMLIPHTLKNTTLGFLKTGMQVNLETDLLAKYVQRQLARSLSD
jgi:riboflavin synthase